MELAGKSIVFQTLGCKLNFAESSAIGKMLLAAGCRRAQAGEPADICIVNTCSVTDTADHKGRQAIHRLRAQHPHAFIVVTGCYAQLKPHEVAAIDGVDLVLGANEKLDIETFLAAFARKSVAEIHTVKTAQIRAFEPICSADDRTRHFLKVQDGCDYYCTYCTIPYARGNSRNPTIASLVAQAEEAAREGGKEIVLTGVNIGDFGKTTGESFLDLCKALDKVEGIERYRISSMEPDLLSDELIEFCSQSRAFMPHFHVPLQSGSDEVLKLMHRRYDKALFAHKIDLIKQKMPDAFIGVDVMVGCRGETPECFEECYEFLDGVDVTQLHVFPYSERPGTAALRIPYVVDDAEKKVRSKRLLDLSEQKRINFYARYIGTEQEVLFEKATRGKAMHGFTANYIRVELPAKLANEEYDNQILRVRLGEFNRDKSALQVELL